jgi:hypothetical protein
MPTAYTSTTKYGPPTNGSYFIGDTFTDAGGATFKCSAAGSPGSWHSFNELVDNTTSVLAAAIGAAPTVTGLACAIERASRTFTLTFTLANVAITCTDAGGSGSSGSLKIFDFVEAGISVLGCRQNYSAITNAAAMTTTDGDAVQVLGIGTAAANAGDGALTGTEANIGSVTSALTATDHVAVGSQFSGALGAIDGTATATDVYLNWSGTAATVDASGTTTVTGTITLVGVLLGDD